MFLHFLVQEGQIRVEGDVMHSGLGRGLGLKLHSLTPKDLPQFEELLSRIRSFIAAPPAADLV